MIGGVGVTGVPKTPQGGNEHVVESAGVRSLSVCAGWLGLHFGSELFVTAGIVIS
jgi:hypothetical protein